MEMPLSNISRRSPRRRSPTRPTSGASATSSGRLPSDPARANQGFNLRNDQRPMASAPNLTYRRFIIFHARHSSAVGPLWPTGTRAAGCGFPVAKILALFHAGTGLLQGVMAASLRSHEMSHFEDVHPALHPGDVLVADRGFCSFAHLALFNRRGVNAVFRIHQRQIVDFATNRAHVRSSAKRSRKGLPRSRRVPQLGPVDQIVE